MTKRFYLARELKNKGRKKYTADKETVESVWHYLNNQIFRGRLVPPEHFIFIRNNNSIWGECDGRQRYHRWGPYYTYSIRLQKNWPNFKLFVEIIAHEMVHQWEWEQQKTMSHSQETFFCWKDKLAEKGLRLKESL